jgi:hypothetical protein
VGKIVDPINAIYDLIIAKTVAGQSLDYLTAVLLGEMREEVASISPCVWVHAPEDGLLNRETWAAAKNKRQGDLVVIVDCLIQPESSLRPYGQTLGTTAIRNDIPRSEELSDSVIWTKTGISITDDADLESPPDAAKVSELCMEQAANSTHVVNMKPTAWTGASLPWAASVYVKSVDRRWVAFEMGSSSGTARGWYDLENGVIGSTAVTGTWTVSSIAIEAVPEWIAGAGWYRLKMLGTAGTGTNLTGKLYLTTADASIAAYTGDITKGAYVRGFQCEPNATAVHRYLKTEATFATGFDPESIRGIVTMLEDVANAIEAAGDFTLDGTAVDFNLDYRDVRPLEANLWRGSVVFNGTLRYPSGGR